MDSHYLLCKSDLKDDLIYFYWYFCIGHKLRLNACFNMRIPTFCKIHEHVRIMNDFVVLEMDNGFFFYIVILILTIGRYDWRVDPMII